MVQLGWGGAVGGERMATIDIRGFDVALRPLKRGGIRRMLVVTANGVRMYGLTSLSLGGVDIEIGWPVTRGFMGARRIILQIRNVKNLVCKYTQTSFCHHTNWSMGYRMRYRMRFNVQNSTWMISMNKDKDMLRCSGDLTMQHQEKRHTKSLLHSTSVLQFYNFKK